MSSNWPIVLIEGIMVFGGALAFAWWQLRDIKRDQKKAADERAAREWAAAAAAATAAQAADPAAAPAPRDGDRGPAERLDR
jgi:hypothetical protein